MARPPVSISVEQARLLERLHDLQNRANNPQVLPVIGRKVTTLIQLGFRNSASPWGHPWQPLNGQTTRRGKPLQDSGRLRNSISWQVHGDTVAIGTNVDHARVHQFGAVIKPVTARMLRWVGPRGPIYAKEVIIPARPFMPITDTGVSLPPAWHAQIVEAIRQHLIRRGGA